MSNISPEEEEFEALYRQAKVAYPEMPPFLLKVALKASLREEELQKSKKFPKKKHLIDVENVLEDEWKRAPWDVLEYRGMEIVPPKEEEAKIEEMPTEDGEEASSSAK